MLYLVFSRHFGFAKMSKAGRNARGGELTPASLIASFDSPQTSAV